MCKYILIIIKILRDNLDYLNIDKDVLHPASNSNELSKIS